MLNFKHGMWIIVSERGSVGLLGSPKLTRSTILAFHSKVIQTVWYRRREDRHRSMEGNWESRNKPSPLWSVAFWQGCGDDSVREATVFSTNGAGTTGCSYAEDWRWAASLRHTRSYLKCYLFEAEILRMIEQGCVRWYSDRALKVHGCGVPRQCCADN